jgi:hypothetical protein
MAINNKNIWAIGTTLLTTVVCVIIFCGSPNDNKTLALQYYSSADFKLSKRYFESYFRKNGNENFYRILYADNLRRLGNKDKAIAVCRELLCSDTTRSGALNLLGMMSTVTDSQMFYFREAIRCDSCRPEPWVNLWFSLIPTADTFEEVMCLHRIWQSSLFSKKALKHYQTILESLPDNAVLFVNDDMSTIVPAINQTVLGVRRDVIVVNIWLLRNLMYTQKMLRLCSVMSDVSNVSANSEISKSKCQVIGKILPWISAKQKGNIKRPLTVLSRMLIDDKCMDLQCWINKGPICEFTDVNANSGVDVDRVKEYLSKVHFPDYSTEDLSPIDSNPIRRKSVLVRGFDHEVMDVALELAKCYRNKGNTGEQGKVLAWVEDFMAQTRKYRDIQSVIDSIYKPLNR